MDAPHNEFMILGITLNIYFSNFEEEKKYFHGPWYAPDKGKLEELLEALALLRKGLKTDFFPPQGFLTSPP